MNQPERNHVRRCARKGRLPHPLVDGLVGLWYFDSEGVDVVRTNRALKEVLRKQIENGNVKAAAVVESN